MLRWLTPTLLAALLVAPAAAAQPIPDRGGVGANRTQETYGTYGTHEPPELRAAPTPGPAHGAGFTAADRRSAEAAWGYIAANRQVGTGLVNGTAGFSYATTWDIGSGLAALVSAEQLGVIDRGAFTPLAERLLATLATLPLYNGELPNREYDTRTAQMVGLRHRAGQGSAGSGWSAIDLGRLLVWLKIAAAWYPEHAARVAAIVGRWKFDRLALNGEMNGTLFDGQRERLRQEGRLGYEEYAATGFALWGVQLPKAFDRDAITRVVVDGIELPHDTRNLAFLTSEPFMLAKLEVGPIDAAFDAAAAAVYAVQKRHAAATGVLVAVSEDSADAEPWFVYNNIYFDGLPWNCVDHNGRPAPRLGSLSTKAAFAWWAVFPDEYSERLKNAVGDRLATPRGYYAGIYGDGRINRSLNVNTNAAILESLLYVRRGRASFLKPSQ